MKMPNVFNSVFVYIFCFSPIYLSKENYENGINKLHSNNDCSKCRILTNSFNNWLDKTSRGKYEGGDAAWEETKLKNYAHSEMRLVEIQEKICSDLKLSVQDQCYIFAEEVESDLEKWWYLDNSRSIDLFTWLCIDELKYCCPENHFGDQCQPCLVNKINEVCSGHGKCDGDGTRKGNGSCICETGYDGDICNKCKINYFNNEITDTCEPCNKACNGCHGSGASACLECAHGWTLKSETCVDVNECNYYSKCKRGEYCVNSEGSYVCKTCDKSCQTCSGAGPSNCTSCYSNDFLWSGKCLDEDEQQHMINSTLIRGISFCIAVTLSLVMFRKYICVTSIFVLSTSTLYIYFETHYEKGILYPFMYDLNNGQVQLI